MGTITICIDDETERRFRQLARETLGEKKGYLGKATTEAIEYWIRERQQEAIAEMALDLLKKERHLGKHLYKTRQDIHDR
jgi:predicted transcriptional regulator